MRIGRSWWLGATAGIVLVVGMFLVVPAWAAPTRALEDPLAAMHAACASGDAQAMRHAMNSLTDEEWRAMGDHMKNGSQSTQGFDMMVTGGMMGAGWARGMMAQ